MQTQHPVYSIKGWQQPCLSMEHPSLEQPPNNSFGQSINRLYQLCPPHPSPCHLLPFFSMTLHFTKADLFATLSSQLLGMLCFYTCDPFVSIRNNFSTNPVIYLPSHFFINIFPLINEYIFLCQPSGYRIEILGKDN